MTELEPIGWTLGGTPVWPAAGARVQITAVDDDDEAEEDLDDDADDAEEAERQAAARERAPRRDRRQRDDEAEYRPPTREEWERVQDAVRRNNSENRKRRLIGKRLEALGVDESNLDEWLREQGFDPDTGQKVEPEESRPEAQAQQQPAEQLMDRAALTRAEQRGAARVEAEMGMALMRSVAKSALLEAGWTGKNVNLALKLIEPDDLTWDSETETFIGLPEQIDQIKSELPQLFRRRLTNDSGDEPERRAPRRRRGADVVDGADRGRRPSRPPTWEEQLNERLERL